MTDVPPVDSVTWLAAIGDASGVRFGELTRPDVVLEGSVFAHPVVGAVAVLAALRLCAAIYTHLQFVHEASSPGRAVLEFEAEALGIHASGVTVLTLDDAGFVRRVDLYHRPFGAVLRIATELGDRLTTSTNGRRTP